MVRVVRVVPVVRDSGLANRTDAMLTTIEGSGNQAMEAVQQAVQAIAARTPRVSLVDLGL